MKIPTSLALATIGACVLIFGAVGYYRFQDLTETEAKPEQVVDASLPYQTEEAWTVTEISQFLADLGAVSQKVPTARVQVRQSGKPGVYDVRWGGQKAVVSVSEGVWNPATYQSWATDVLAPAQTAEPDVTCAECAQTLLDPGVKTFQHENARISGFLNAHPASAQGHLQAAMLVGTVALNDFSGTFRDLRIPLNRMTAHLAAADALGLKSTDSGRQLAEALRLTLCGQQAAALAQLDAWDRGEDPGLAEWDAILRLRNTLDWRNGGEAAVAGSRALKLEYFRALTHAIGASVGAEFLEAAGIEPDIAVCRIANEVSLSIGDGHRFTRPLFQGEWMEAAAAAEIGESGGEKDLVAYLDTPEGSPVQDGIIDVAGRNLLAGYHQRHLMQATNQLFSFFNERWGVRENAAKLRDFIENQMPDLRYKPFLVRLVARDDASRAAANEPCVELIKSRPEMVTPALWLSLRWDQNGNTVSATPDFHAWFHPEVPQGTAFETGERLYQIGVGDENDQGWLKTLWERSPYSTALAKHNAFLENGRNYDTLSGEILAKWYGPVADYHLEAVRRLAACYKDQPDRYESAMRKAASLDPDNYMVLGEYFAERNMPEKAAAAYLDGFEKADNHVLVAHYTPWLVKYLFETGDLAMARKVAEYGAEVYSYNGLLAALWLQEKQGQWEAALETARKIDERYNETPIEETACLLRMGETDRKRADDFGYAEKVGRLFPNGLQKVSLSDFSEAPEKGVLINGTARTLEPFGLARNMVIVSVNGYRTENFPQYAVIRSFIETPDLSLVVWDGNSYRLSEGTVPGGMFGVDMIDYTAR